MENGVDALDAFKSRLQGRDDVLTQSLDRLERERDLIRRELGLVEELVTAEQQRAAMVPAVPTPEPEPTAQSVLAVETQPEPEPAAKAQPEPVLTAQAVPDALPDEAPNPTLRRVEALQRLRAGLIADTAVPDLVTPRAANVGLLRRVDHLQHVGRS